ncbi:MAG: sulfatase-like hydrolase/transferase [Pirellulaceae bacterium]|nr:sulfatase-like hydrolase/transferase [Pirellulaceae bacterium]
MRIQLAIVLPLLMAASAASIGAETPVRPNIILLLCDDLGYGDLGCFAHPTIQSPHLDRLASEGVRLTHCYSAAPVCSPARGGLMTGRNPNRLGIRDWIPAHSGIYLREGEVTVAQLLRQAGYRTCHVGKWHLNSRVDGSEPTPGDAGFEHWFYTQNNVAPNHLNPVNFVRNGQPAGPLKGPSSHVVVDEAMRWLDGIQQEPFFLNVWFHEPHELVMAAQEFLDLYPDEPNLDRRHYYGDVSQMDAAVGKLMKYLDDRQMREDTFVVFTSDNGPETLNRYKTANRSYGTPGPLRGMKLHVTEAGYRVPGIVRWPGRIQAGTTSAQPMCGVDLLPTFCALAGIDPPSDRTLDGANILPLLQNQPIERPHPLYWQYDNAISTPWVIALRDGPWKLLANAGLDRFQLYHVADDIGEQQDLAAQHPERVQAMAAEMKRLHTEIRAEGAKSGNPTPTAPQPKR